MDIEFRAWDKEANAMVFWGTEEYYMNLDGNGLGLASIEQGPDGEYIEEIEGAIFMQYTGLKDRNGVKIFEGDIVRVGSEVAEWEFTCTVKYSGGCFYADCSEYMPGLCCVTHTYEVIGNIHENPELLNG